MKRKAIIMSKKRIMSTVCIALACIMIGAAIPAAVNGSAKAETTTTIVTSPFTAAIAEVQSSVVGVRNYQTVSYRNGNSGMDTWGYFFGDRFGRSGGNEPTITTQEVLAATGSGVVIGKGYVLTNYHVVEDSTSVKVTVAVTDSDEPKVYDAQVVATDKNLDVAVVNAPDLDLEPVKLGDSDTMQVGDWAICIGNPLGEDFQGTVTAGIVSALNRAVSSSSYDKYGRKETIVNTMIQVDAAINSGNSGGGMFNTQGELMGIPTLKYSGNAFSGSSVEGIGMCIPINAAKPLIEDVLSGKIPTEAMPEKKETTVDNALVGKPRLGVTVSNLNTSNVYVQQGLVPNGVYVSEVEKNGPADEAGMMVDDIIVDVNDTVITSANQLTGIISGAKEGDVLRVKVFRVEGGLSSVTSPDNFPESEYVEMEITLKVVDAVKG